MHLPAKGARSLPCKGKVAPATLAIGRAGEGMGLRGTEGRSVPLPHPPPSLPLEGGGVPLATMSVYWHSGTYPCGTWISQVVFGTFLRCSQSVAASSVRGNRGNHATVAQISATSAALNARPQRTQRFASITSIAVPTTQAPTVARRVFAQKPTRKFGPAATDRPRQTLKRWPRQDPYSRPKDSRTSARPLIFDRRGDWPSHERCPLPCRAPSGLHAGIARRARSRLCEFSLSPPNPAPASGRGAVRERWRDFHTNGHCTCGHPGWWKKIRVGKRREEIAQYFDGLTPQANVTRW